MTAVVSSRWPSQWLADLVFKIFFWRTKIADVAILRRRRSRSGDAFQIEKYLWHRVYTARINFNVYTGTHINRAYPEGYARKLARAPAAASREHRNMQPVREEWSSSKGAQRRREREKEREKRRKKRRGKKKRKEKKQESCVFKQRWVCKLHLGCRYSVLRTPLVSRYLSLLFLDPLRVLSMILSSFCQCYTPRRLHPAECLVARCIKRTFSRFFSSSSPCVFPLLFLFILPFLR